MAYLLPGAVLAAGILLFLALYGEYFGFATEYKSISRIVHDNWPKEWYDYATVSICIAVGLYILGHIIALLSAMTIDAFFIKRLHGYPFETMLQARFPRHRFEQHKRFLSKGAHGFFLLALVLSAIRHVSIVYCNFLFWTCLWLLLCRVFFTIYPQGGKRGTFIGVVLLVRFSLIGIIAILTGVAGISWIIDFSGVILMDVWWTATRLWMPLWNIIYAHYFLGAVVFLLVSALGAVGIYYTASARSVRWMKAFENQKADIDELFAREAPTTTTRTEQDPGISLVQYVPLAIAFIPSLLGHVVYFLMVRPVMAVTGIYRPMSKEFRIEFCKCCSAVFEPDCIPDSNAPCQHRSDLYWLTSTFLGNESMVHNLNIRHWLNLYSFARNLCMAVFILFVVGIIAGRTTFSNPDKYPYYYLWPLVCGMLSMLLLHRYTYLYFKYFSKYIARAFVSYVKAVDFKQKNRDAEVAGAAKATKAKDTGQ